MAETLGTKEVIKGTRTNKRYQRYFDSCNRRFFCGKLPHIKVLTAPLLKVTKFNQGEAEKARYGESLIDAGYYGLAAYNDDGDPVIIIDRGTAIYHPLISKQSVLHEMCHHSIGLEYGHGKHFKKEVRRIAALGALDSLI